ncbi:MAG: sodium-translocating pyrophosphatase [Candidatus ainarchaeum sp.]|nr:sodium-translocating pyrophosphatase [Candidatus ainarchaeum sp.]MDD5096087.1 sodium-translocating pyrophosphatase [Candidatus ainarchaeum sp.]
MDAIQLAFASGALTLLYALWLAFSVSRAAAGDKKMQDISAAVREGANAFLKRQYVTLAPIVVVLAAAIYLVIGQSTAVAFLAGVVCSALAGYVGMQVSVRANVRVAEAAKRGLNPALSLAFQGGAVTGMALVGLGLLGLAGLYTFFGGDLAPLIGYGFGASLISLFARVGGGIYTKAADVGADLVGKIEKGIPEDDPRNPAVIADNVGDNVGDCAGMAADVFESFVVTIIAAMLIGMTVAPQYVLLPLAIAAVGGVASMIGSLFVWSGKDGNIMNAFYRAIFVTGIAAILGYYVFAYPLSPEMFYVGVVGVVVTALLFTITDYYTAKNHRPVKSIAEAAKTGAGTNLIQGLAIGMESTALPVLVVVAAIIASYSLGGMYGIALAAAAMLSLSGIIIAVDSYGPITDNAGGIAEMAGLPPKVREITDSLDSVGNTTKATTKGFAIGGAALGALALFVAFAEEAGITSISLLDPMVVVGLFIGAMLPFIFSSFLMTAVGRAAFQIVEEVRRQFREIKGLMKGKAKPDYAKCVDISTKTALAELAVPGIIAVLAPIVVGVVLGVNALAGLLAGTIASGLMMALFMCTSGAAWDNGKKLIEDGVYGGKGSDAHKAAVVGDTVGDPLKDTAGPSLNALIKVVNTVSLVFASAIIAYGLHLFA